LLTALVIFGPRRQSELGRSTAKRVRDSKGVTGAKSDDGNTVG
jgi:hypothetical protein